MSNNLLILKDGKIIAEGSKEDIFEHPRKLAVAQITECKNFSQARAISSQKVKALDWNCTLKVVETIPDSLTHIGIRAHHIAFADELEPENTFKCWVTETSETQHRMTAYLKLNSPLKTLKIMIYKWKFLRKNGEIKRSYFSMVRLLRSFEVNFDRDIKILVSSVVEISYCRIFSTTLVMRVISR